MKVADDVWNANEEK